MTTSITIAFPITKMNEFHFFDFYIPDDVKVAFDVEADISATNIPGMQQFPNISTAGMIHIQSPYKAGLCYSSLIPVKQSPVEALLPDFGNVHGEILQLFQSPYYCREYGMSAQTRSVQGRVMYGYYKDLTGAQVNGNVSYTVTLTIWANI